MDDIKGKRFARLTATGEFQWRGGKRAWECRCDCGKLVYAKIWALRSGNTKSCGCWSLEMRTKTVTKHGRSSSRMYGIWSAMIARCHNPTNRAFRWYGGRGIKVCDRWRESIENFIEDMGDARHGLSLDRINNDGDYEPSNCRWATDVEQANNTRKNRRIEYMGRMVSVSEAARMSGLPRGTIKYRMESGWPASDIFKDRWSLPRHYGSEQSPKVSA